MASIGRLVFVIAWFITASVSAGRLVILQTADIHGAFEAEEEDEGGWLRMASLIREQREAAGEENTLLIDCGDTIQGTFTASHSRGEIAAAMLNHLDYDAWIFGNHELDYGIPRMVELAHFAGDIVINGNMRVTRAGYETEYPGFRLFERGGLRVAVVGINSGFLANWHWGGHVEGFEVESGLTTLKRVMPEIHALPDVDLIVLAAHQGFSFYDKRGVNEIKEIVESFPEIDIVLGGHTHREIAGRIIGQDSWYVQAGAHARSLAVIEVEYESETKDIVNIVSRLLPADPGTAVCRKAEEAVACWLEPARVAGEEVIGSASAPITARGRPGKSSRTSELLSRAIAAASGAEIVIQGRLSNADLEAGEITRKDIFSIVPYENRITLLDLTRSELEEVIEEQAAMRDSYAHCGVYGIYVELDKNGKVKTILDSSQQPLIEEENYYITAFNSYTLAGGGARFPALRKIARRAEKEKRLEFTDIWTRDAVEDYLKDASSITMEPVKWLR